MDDVTTERATQAAAELVVSVDRLAAERKAAKAKPPLGEGAQMVHNATSKNMDMIFEHATVRIAAVRQALDAMEAGLVEKKKNLIGSLGDYIATLEMIEKHTNTLQTAIGDAMVAQDAVG